MGKKYDKQFKEVFDVLRRMMVVDSTVHEQGYYKKD